MWAATAVLVAAVVGTLDVGGCNSGPPATQPASAADRQDAALRDPMGYKPTVNGTSDGDVTHFDSTGFKRDVNDVLNP